MNKKLSAKKKKKQIAPRLFDGECREHYSLGLPPEVKSALKDIAIDENQSVSWVMEQVIYDYFEIKRPRFITKKEN